MTEEPRPWPLISSRPGPDLLIFRARFDTVRNPRTSELHTRLVLETPPWVTVVALTPEHRLVVVRQHRFGRQGLTTEIPGGVVDRGETPLQAAQRELREETGYTSERWTALGAVEPNPAFHDNLCLHFLAEEAIPSQPPSPEAGEDLQVDTLDLAEARRAILAGEIRHSLVITALAHVLDLRSR